MTRKWWSIKWFLLLALVSGWGGVEMRAALGVDIPLLPDVPSKDTIAVHDTLYIYRSLSLSDEEMPAAQVSSLPDSVLVEKLSRYEVHMLRFHRFWERLIPNQFSIQYAGSIGLVSYGFGWHYGKKSRLETDILIGHLPRYNSENRKVTLTLKQRYVPWHCTLGSRWTFSPLLAGLFVNSIFGEDFWAKEPSRYPKRYYGFSTKIRLNVFLGQDIRYSIPASKRRHIKSFAFYYELSSCDLEIVSALPNKEIGLLDILSLGLGLKLQLF